MSNFLLGIGPINSALRLAHGVLGAITGAGRNNASYAQVQRQALEGREQDAGLAAASASVPAGAIGAATPAAGTIVPRAAAIKSYAQVLRSQAEGMMKQLDADGDKMLAAAELGVSTAEFQRIDEDGNGDVDIEELTRAMQAGRVPTWKA